MYIYQNGKLYILVGENKLVGVEIYPDKVVKIKEEAELAETYDVLTKREVVAKFHIEEEPYIFPIEKKEVVKNDTTGKTKATAKQSK